ncbi:MAG: TolC family protein [Acidobacteriota bacterium]|nr:TolC family protein [Acidobacteriota bacterium]
MIRRAAAGCLALMWISLLPLQGLDEEKTLALSLDECIARTVTSNLGLAVERITPAIADVSVDLARERFLPSMTSHFNKQDTNSASFSFLDASETVTTLQNDYSLQIAQVIPTGANFALGLTGYMTDTNRRFQSINPRYGNTLRFTFSQPLLKDFGPKMSRRDILVAKNNRDVSEQLFQQALEDTVYSAESAYWNLVYSIENLKVRRQSLKLAQELLEKNRAEIQAGTLAPIEILTAEADVATREADILEAETLVRNFEDLLKTIINLPAEFEDVESVRIRPTDAPSVRREDLSLDRALKTAMARRPDLQASRIDLRTRELNMSYARNQLFPDLRLQASYWSPGISGDQILYEGGNALTGAVIGIVPGGSSDALRDAVNFRYKNWSVGLSLSFPLNNILTRALYKQNKLGLEQARIRLQNSEQRAFLEIRNAVRTAEANYLRISAYRAARELAQRKLEAEEEKFKVGLSTNYFILQYQRDLASAQIMELRALVDYSISLANLDRVQGTGVRLVAADEVENGNNL